MDFQTRHTELLAVITRQTGLIFNTVHGLVHVSFTTTLNSSAGMDPGFLIWGGATLLGRGHFAEKCPRRTSVPYVIVKELGPVVGGGGGGGGLDPPMH